MEMSTYTRKYSHSGTRIRSSPYRGHVSHGEESFSSKTRKHIKNNPEDCDIQFEVGVDSKKETIKFFRNILKVACGWDFPKELKLVQLPDMDPKAFRIFIYHVTSNYVSAQTLEEEIGWDCFEELFNLDKICKHFGMRNFEEALYTRIKELYSNFWRFSKADFFNHLSVSNLEKLLSSEELVVNTEFDVFECAYKWAVSQCSAKKIPLTGANICDVLGRCFLQIRFPVMSNLEFGLVANEKPELGLLSNVPELLEIYKYISMTAEQKYNFDSSKLRFITRDRWGSSLLSSVSFLENGQVGDSTFICDSKPYMNCFQVNHDILVYGVSFLGPADISGDYYVHFMIHRNPHPQYCPVKIAEVKTSIFAKKQETFHVMLEKPVLLQSNWNDNEFDENTYGLRFTLMGPDTQQISMRHLADGRLIDEQFDFHTEEDGVKFSCNWEVGQLTHLRFKKF